MQRKIIEQAEKIPKYLYLFDLVTYELMFPNWEAVHTIIRFKYFHCHYCLDNNGRESNFSYKRHFRDNSFFEILEKYTY